MNNKIKYLKLLKIILFVVFVIIVTIILIIIFLPKEPEGFYISKNSKVCYYYNLGVIYRCDNDKMVATKIGNYYKKRGEWYQSVLGIESEILSTRFFIKWVDFAGVETIIFYKTNDFLITNYNKQQNI